jgi:signal transduction histidine kinase
MKTLMVGIQPLFRSSRRRNKELFISDIVKTVQRYYEIPLKENKIEVLIKEIGSPLSIKSSEGVLLQLFINLMDNAIYWLRVSDTTKPTIEVLIDGDHGSTIFADNGPGIEKKYVNYIFEPFFSRKGIQGRGLGLYIARQLADRYEYDLYYLEEEGKGILPGANFKIDFLEQEE